MGKHIVIVDDDTDVVENAKLRLEANGYQVSSTMGKNTIQDLLKYKPDLILLDVLMPEVDGFALIRTLRRDPDLSKVPVIIFSARPKEAMEQLFGPEGIAGYIAKPYDPVEMLKEIKKALGS